MATADGLRRSVKGLSEAEFRERFGTEEACREALFEMRRGEGGISSIELGRRLGVEQGTAWLVKHKLMRAMAAREATKPKLEGRVEVDDAYLGGERPGGERGRGAAGKTPVVAAVETTAERKP